MAKSGFGELKKESKAKAWMNEKFVPVLGKIGNQTHINALKDGFMLLLPMIIASSIAILLKTSVFGGAGTEKTSLLGVFAVWSNAPLNASGLSFTSVDASGTHLTVWGQISDEASRVFDAMYNFGLNALSIYFAFTFGFSLARARGNNAPEIAGLVSLGCFFIATAGGASSASFINLSGNAQSLASDFRGSSGMFTAIVTTIISIEIFCRVSAMKRLEIHMPAGVPPAIARSFAKLFPILASAFAVTLLFAIVAVPTHLTNADMLTSQQIPNSNSTRVGVSQATPGSFYNLGDAIFMAVQSPFIYAASLDGANLGIAVLVAFLTGIMWFFGLHGTSIVFGIFLPVFTIILTNNQELLATKGPSGLQEQGSIFMTETFYSYIWLGGTCAALPLIASSLIFSKNKAEREVAKFAIPAAVFEVNEPVMFGYPLVANIRYAIPMIFIMPILCVMTWVFYEAFGTTKISIAIPWTSPPGLGALFATQFDWTSFIIVLINLCIAFAMWTPFVIISSHAAKKEEKIRLEEKMKLNEASK